MTTTAVFAEILIVGLEAAAWIALVVLDRVGRIHTGNLSDYGTLATFVVLAASYVLGVVIDRTADSLFKQLEDTAVGRQLNYRFGERSLRWILPAKVATMRFAVMQASGGMGGFLEYQRSRMRIARGTSLNLVFLVPAATTYLWRHGHVDAAIVIVIVGVFAFVASVFAGERIKSAWLRNLCEAYRVVVGKSDESKPIRNAVVAGVCHRSHGGELEVLLVRTSGGRKWTFPKGHIEAGESPTDALRREIREEAGVTGEPESEPFTAYRYPTGSWKPNGGGPEEFLVDAYLVRVARPDQKPVPKEKKRTPKWCKPAKARKRLTKNREERYADEQVRVLSEAMIRLKAAS